MESYHKSLCSIIHSISASPTWIDEDLLAEILKRLPVKALCRFRSVCRCWNSLVSSASFIKLHYSFNSHSSTTPAHLKPYLRLEDSEDRCHIYYDLCRPQDGHLGHRLFFPFRLRLAPGLGSNDNLFQFVDLIRGVVCLSYSSAKSHFASTILWNPATHGYVVVPSTVNSCEVIGFGYDCAKNDFKVVRICYRSHLLDYEVFSAQQGTWRAAIADHIKIGYLRGAAGCFVNGSIHWLVCNEDLLVLLFDCELEEFRTMELPKEIQNPDAYDKQLLDYGGMLSVFVAVDCGIMMWVMEENDAATAWKKLYKISEDTNAIDIYETSYLKLAPYGPNEWIKFRSNDDLAVSMYSNYVYLESMFLMDDTNARFYTNEETLYIDN